MYRKVPRKWDSLRFLAVIDTWFLSTGGLPRKSCALARNDSYQAVYMNSQGITVMTTMARAVE